MDSPVGWIDFHKFLNSDSLWFKAPDSGPCSLWLTATAPAVSSFRLHSLQSLA